MGTNESSYLTIDRFRQTVTIDLYHRIEVSSAVTVSTTEELRGPASDVIGVYVTVGPLSMAISSEEALQFAAALTEAALFYREKKVAALEHYEAMAREARQSAVPAPCRDIACSDCDGTGRGGSNTTDGSPHDDCSACSGSGIARATA